MFAPDITHLASIEPAACSVAEVEAALGAIGRVRGRLDALEARLLRRAETLAEEGHGAGGSASLRDQQRTSGRRAEQAARRAETLAAAPPFEAALESGAVGADHVDALTRAAGALPDERRARLYERADALLEVATATAPESFERHCRRIARRLDVDEGEARLDRQKRQTRLQHWVDGHGMLCLRGEFDPENAARLLASVDAEVARLVQVDGLARDDHTAALALLSLATRPGGTGPVRPAELVVLVDAETRHHGLHDDSVCETSSGLPLPPTAADRLTCDGDLSVVALGPGGIALAVGRQRRTATRAQRRALRAMYPTCGFAECDRPFDRCEIHHLVPWESGGRTDLDNLLPLCARHHHLVHDRRWTLHLDDERTLTIIRADGAVHAQLPLPSATTARRRADEAAEMCRLARARLTEVVAPLAGTRRARSPDGVP